MTLNFWILASLITCHFPKSLALAKMLLACAKGLGSGVRGCGIFWKRLILVSIHNYLNMYMCIFWAKKLNLVARITSKLLDGRSEQFWENWQSQKFYITGWKSNFNLIDTRLFLDWGWIAHECQLARADQDWDRSIGLQCHTTHHEVSTHALNKT
jgi:hypothetical protein